MKEKIKKLISMNMYWGIKQVPGNPGPLKFVLGAPENFQTLAQMATEIWINSCAKPVAGPHKFFLDY
jgi:hypothetical protein